MENSGDRDLSSVAVHAAAELDKLIRKERGEVPHVLRLAAYFRKQFEGVGDAIEMNANLAVAIFSILSTELREEVRQTPKFVEYMKRQATLLYQIGKIAPAHEKVSFPVGDGELRRLMQFCVDLSRRTMNEGNLPEVPPLEEARG